jgi:hypothetical protein
VNRFALLETNFQIEGVNSHKLFFGADQMGFDAP